jgi:hypothetical protein
LTEINWQRQSPQVKAYQRFVKLSEWRTVQRQTTQFRKRLNRPGLICPILRHAGSAQDAPDTRSAIEGYLSTITRPDSLAAYKYLLYNIGESLNGESIIGIDKEGIEKAISLLKSDNQRKYAVSCVKSMLLHALKTNPKSRFTMRKSLLFWMLGIE